MFLKFLIRSLISAKTFKLIFSSNFDSVAQCQSDALMRHRSGVKFSPESYSSNPNNSFKQNFLLFTMIRLLEKRRIISIIFTILIASEIFFFSSLSGPPGARFPIISIAYHFIVFFLFAFFFLASIKNRGKIKLKYLIITIITSVLYALSDEFHQSFISGRDAGIKDILTDSAGIFSSILIYIFMNKKNKNQKNQPIENPLILSPFLLGRI